MTQIRPQECLMCALAVNSDTLKWFLNIWNILSFTKADPPTGIVGLVCSVLYMCNTLWPWIKWMPVYFHSNIHICVSAMFS